MDPILFLPSTPSRYMLLLLSAVHCGSVTWCTIARGVRIGNKVVDTAVGLHRHHSTPDPPLPFCAWAPHWLCQFAAARHH